MQVWLQKLIPQHALSRLMGCFGNCTNATYKNWMIAKFIKAYGVDMSEALNEDPKSYACFNEFFTRPLKPGQRDFDKPDDVIISPADGAISEFGPIQQGQLLQAKGNAYSLEALVADKDAAADFQNGTFMTIYLSPKDYHRVHMPFGGTLTKMTYVPGSLFSVNEAAVDGVPGLFARNERAVCLFDTEIGPMAVIMVGAMIVASIHTVWAGQAAPQRSRHLTEWNYEDQELTLDRGAEMGFFQMGSTAIILFPENTMQFLDSLNVSDSIRLGDPLGTLL
ncbi:MAG: phosphatidylserine decarboxylase [Coxiella sp. (in: Bacteria)]|nr:MAG: phosphatidylserine decarboxylase [Coxiella sp. (in: g-proteobacteria)]